MILHKFWKNFENFERKSSHVSFQNELTFPTDKI